MNIEKIVSGMTLEEKADMLTGRGDWYVKNCPRLGVPEMMVSDGPHGLRKQEEQTDILGIHKSVQAVCFPSAAGMACSFDPAALRLLGETLGQECRAENLAVLLGPGINIKRSPLCGRNFEYFSEDPYLAGKLAAAYVSGVQSKGVGTSVKHFAANNQEYRRMSISSVVDERTLREIYLPAFETVVKESQPWSVMCSYNKINGTYASENWYLLTKILRQEWGFQGFVVTDWGASCHRAEGVEAGCDLEMPSTQDRNTKKIIQAVGSGTLPEPAVDTAVKRVLTAGAKAAEHNREQPEFCYRQDHDAARRLAEQCMVLLKNEDAVLPLSREQNIAFIGEFAEKPRYQGGGSSHVNPYQVVSALEAVNGSARVTYAKGYDSQKEEAQEALIHQAVEVACKADVAVLFVGLTDAMESEGFDRKHLELPAAHNRLVDAIASVQPNTVVVLHNGSPVKMPWLPKVKGVLEAYLAGEACGEAVTRLLFGDAVPSGKLAETFPLALEDTPCARYFPGNPQTVEYREGVYVGYRYYDKAEKAVLFPFGHGLSYTEFAYSNLIVHENGANQVRVSVTVKNTGGFDGAEVVQIYVAPPAEQGFRPAKELRGFQKVFLKQGESETVTFDLEERAFAYYHPVMAAWVAPAGNYQVLAGSSSRDIRQTAVVEKKGEAVPPPIDPVKCPSYYSGKVQAVPDEEFCTLLGTALPPAFREAGKKFTLYDSIDDARETKWGKRIIRLLTKVASGPLANYVEAALTAPIRIMIGFFGGAVTEQDANALVDLLNDEHTLRALRTLAGHALRLKQGKK